MWFILMPFFFFLVCLLETQKHQLEGSLYWEGQTLNTTLESCTMQMSLERPTGRSRLTGKRNYLWLHHDKELEWCHV